MKWLNKFKISFPPLPTPPPMHAPDRATLLQLAFVILIAVIIHFSIAKFFIARDEKELRKIIRKGKKVRILVFDEEPENMIADIESLLPAKHYQQFMSVKEDNAIIKFMVRDNLTFISELIIFVYEENSLVVMGIDGKFTYEDIKKLTDNFQEND